MSLLLFLARELEPLPDDPGTVLFPINPFSLDFHFDAPVPMGARRAGPFGAHGQLANQYVRFMVGFEIAWTLGNRAILKCQTIDPFEDDPTNAYRPATGDEVTVVSRQEQIALFRGHVVDPRERALAEANTYTVVEIDAADVAEELAHRFLSTALGGDPVPVANTSAGNPTQIATRDAHGLATGDVARISGVANAGVHPVNGDRVVTVIDSHNFTVPVNTVGVVPGAGGTVEKLVTMRDIVVSLSPILTEHNVTVDPDMLAGPRLRKQTFSDKSVTEILRAVSGQSGWIHRFVPNTSNGWTLQMFEPGSVVAPFTIGKADVLEGLTIRESKTDKANSIVVRYGSPMTVTKHEYHAGDGVKRVFPLKYKYTRDATVAPGHVYDHRPGQEGWRHVGIYGTDTLFEWVFLATGPDEADLLVQLETYAGTTTVPLPVGQSVETVFAARFPQVVKVSNVPAGHAPREIIVSNETIFDDAAARDFGNAELAKSNTPQRVATLSTAAGLIWPGTAVNVNLPHRLMTGQWLVTAVRMTERGDGSLVYQYDLTEGNTAAKLWQDKIRDLFGGSSGAITSVGGNTPGAPSPGVPPGAIGVTGTGTDGYFASWTGPTSIGNAPMFLRGDGAVEVAADIIARGDIVADATIVAKGSIWAPVVRSSVEQNGTDNITIQPDGDVVFDPGGNALLPFVNYDVNVGRIDRKFLTLHAAELWVETLVAHETMATIGGRIIVAPTTQLIVDLAPTDTAIRVKHNNLANGETVYMESDGRVEFMRVISGPSGSAGNWSYTVTRNLDGTGANQWYAGDAMVNTGTVGSGFIDIYSVRSMRSEFGPTMVGNVRTAAEFNAWEPRWAVGNIAGLYGYPSSPAVYGTAFGSPAAAWIKIDPTNGVRIGHASTVLAHITAAGSASFTGSVTVTGGNAATMSYADNVAMQQAATRAAIDLSNVTNSVVLAKTGWAYPNTTLINGGNIFTGSILANSIAAGQISSNHIVAGSIVGDRIAANTITAANIAAGTITAGQIQAGSITADRIATGSITSTQIMANSITADRLSVTSLSAISANIGSVTAGTITGVTISGATIYAAGTDVKLNADGISVAVGSNFTNMYKFTNNLGMGTYNNGAGLNLVTGGNCLIGNWSLGDWVITRNTGGGDIGATTARMDNVYSQMVDTVGFRITADSQNAGIGRVLVVSSDRVVHGVSNGVSGSSGGFTFENGICTGMP